MVQTEKRVVGKGGVAIVMAVIEIDEAEVVKVVDMAAIACETVHSVTGEIPVYQVETRDVP